MPGKFFIFVKECFSQEQLVTVSYSYCSFTFPEIEFLPGNTLSQQLSFCRESLSEYAGILPATVTKLSFFISIFKSRTFQIVYLVFFSLDWLYMF